MALFVLRRFLWMIVILLVISLVTFLIYFVLPPENPAAMFAGKSPTPEVLKAVEANLGLNHPVWQQYLLFLKHLVLGDRYGWPGLGYSYVSDSAILSLLGSRIVVTVTLAAGAVVLWLAIGLTIGIVSAVRPRSVFDRAGIVFAVTFVSAPGFWLGLLFLFLFSYKLGILGGTGYVSLSQGLLPWLDHLIMPWLILSLLYAAWYARMTRGSLLETLSQDFIRTARAKGAPEGRVIFRHALRASLLPVLTMFGMDLPGLLGNTVIVEYVFNLQGLGQMAVQSVLTSDLPAVMAVTLIASFAVVLGNFLVDVAYVAVDPRLRIGA